MNKLLEKIGYKPWNGIRFFTSIAAIELLLMLLLSFRLWSNIGRGFYTTSLLPFDLPYPVTVFSFALLINAVVGIIFYKDNKRWLIISLVLLSAMILFDVHRLQVWAYQIILFFLVAILEKDKKIQWKSLCIILGGTYLWAAIHKMNLGFSDIIFPWFMSAFSFTDFLGEIKTLAIIPILIELIIGVLILLGRRLKIAFILALIFHLGILLFLGPWGKGWNYIVFPWNIFSPILIWILYKSQTKKKEKPKFSPVLIATSTLCIILPALNFFTSYPNNLSFQLYSGKANSAYFLTYDSEENIKEKKSIGKWANDDLGIPYFKHNWVDTQLGLKHKRIKNDTIPRGVSMTRVHPFTGKIMEEVEVRFGK